MRRYDLLLILPAYNERENLAHVMNELSSLRVADTLIIDDGSTDGTWELIRENGWRAVRLNENMGLSCAVETGIRYALGQGYTYAMQFDADGQHIARYVPQMLELAKSNALDIVIGARDTRIPGVRGLGARLLRLSIRAATGRTLMDPTSGMRLYSRRVMRLLADSLNLRPEPDTLSYLMRCGAKIAEYTVQMRPRVRGESYLSAVRSTRYMLEMAFSILFLQPRRVRLNTNEEADI